MSNRFHQKFHRHNHHTAANAVYPDSAQDPIASQASPFLGTFYLSGGLSANGPITAPSAVFSFLFANSAIFHITDLLVTELSGFLIQGTDFSKTIPISYDPYNQQAVTLSGIGISGSSWGSFSGDFKVGQTMFSNSVSAPSITTNNIIVNQTLFTNNLSSATSNISAINVYNNLDMHGYSISGIGNNSLAFESGTKIQSDSIGRFRVNSYSVAESIQTGTSAFGQYSHAEGNNASATGTGAHAEGSGTLASGNYSHTEGQGTTSSGVVSHAEGLNTTASGLGAHAEGSNTLASGSEAHAEGNATTASGIYAHAEGNNAIAAGLESHSEGHFTQSDGIYSHAEGAYTFAGGEGSHAAGLSARATGNYSYAAGYATSARGDYSQATGTNTVAAHDRSFVWSSYGSPVSSNSTDQFLVSAVSGAKIGQNLSVIGNLTVSNIISAPIISADSLFVSNSSIHFFNGTTISSNTYTGQVAITPSSQAWTKKRETGWRLMAVNETGKDMIALSGVDNVITSSDYGKSWEYGTSLAAAAVGINNDASTYYALYTPAGRLFVTEGGSWTTLLHVDGFTCMDVSTIVVVAAPNIVYYEGGTIDVYYSIELPSYTPSDISISHDGSCVVVTSLSDSAKMTTNFSTWSTITNISSASQIVVSDILSGANYIMYFIQNNTLKKYNLLTNIVTSLTLPNYNNLIDMDCSADGNTIIVTTEAAGVFVSTDGGSTWGVHIPDVLHDHWSSATCNASGTIFAVVDFNNGGYIKNNEVAPSFNLTSDGININGYCDFTSFSVNIPSGGITPRIVDSFYIDGHNSAFYNLCITDGTNLRASKVMLAWNTNNIVFNETYTSDIGNTADAFLSATKVGDYGRLVVINEDAWTIKGSRQLI